MEITREKYYEAVDIIESYHLQISKKIEELNNVGTTNLFDWAQELRYNKKISLRLFNVIKRMTIENYYYDYSGECTKSIHDPKILYLETILEGHLMSQIQMGKKSLSEFRKLKIEFLNTQ